MTRRRWSGFESSRSRRPGKDVWVCPDPLGHIQATGIDAACRKQYLYHSRWQRRRAERKFEAVREFATDLPALRGVVARDLKLEGMPRERALACAVRPSK